MAEYWNIDISLSFLFFQYLDSAIILISLSQIHLRFAFGYYFMFADSVNAQYEKEPKV